MKKQWVRLTMLLLSAVMLVACVPPTALAREIEGERPAVPADTSSADLPVLTGTVVQEDLPAQLAEAAAPPSGQPTGTYATPSDKLSGTSSNGPMSDEEVSSYFRIPALVTLDNGWIVAACDARWPNTNDSPNNLDTIVSVSKDGGETWEWEIVNYFADFAPIQGATYYPGTSKTVSASFIDPALLVDGSGTLWMAVDLQPSNVNLGQNAQKVGSGFDADGYLMVGNISEADWGQKVNTAVGRTEATRAEYEAYYEYRVDINGTSAKTVEKDGKPVKLFPIFHKEDEAKTSIGYYVDPFFDLWYDYGGDGGVKPVLCLQKDRTDTWVQANLFYRQSDWKAYSTTYLMLRTATVNEDTGKLEWSDPKLVTGVKQPGETFLAFCPGRGTVIPLENGKERLVFQVYDTRGPSATDSNVSSGQWASAVYSDDGGTTWTRGARTENLGDTASSSESQTVLLPDGTLRMYSRNTGNRISYADSTDNGATWGASQFDSNLPYCGGCMVSFINVKGRLVGPNGQTHENLLLASYPKTSYRSEGVIRIGSVDPDTNVVTWHNDDTIRFPNRYNYSCLTQLTGNDSDGDFAVLYEQDDTSQTKGVMAMRFVKLTAADLMGDGWTLDTSVSLDADTSLIDLDVGASKTLAPEYAPSDAAVTCTSYNKSVVTTQGATVTAVGSGEAVVILSVTKDGFTRSVTIPVLVQPEDGLVLPEEYRSGLTKTVTPGSTDNVLVEKAELTDGTYLIFNGTSHVMHNNNGFMDRCQATAADKKLTESTSDHDAVHQWVFAKQADGSFTIANSGKYLTTNTNANGKLIVGDSPVGFAVTYADGTYKITNGGKLFVYDGEKWAFTDATTTTVQLFERHVTPAATTYTVTADGLRALIRALGLYEDNYSETLDKADVTYNDEAEALAAQAAIDEAAKPLYAQLRTGNTTQYTVTYMVGDTLWGVQTYFAGQTIVPMTRPDAPSGQVFNGWTGLPADKLMPDHDLTLTASFRAADSGSTGGNPSRPSTKPAEEAKDPVVPAFDDVVQNAWYSSAIATVVEKGIMEAVEGKRFAPGKPMTRGMTARALYCLAEKPEVLTSSSFLDLAENVNYADAVAWGSAHGVITGYAPDLFGGEDTLTREQLATLLYRYAKLIDKRDVAANAQSLTQFPDSGSVSGWAAEAMAWAVSNELVIGRSDGTLAPKTDITRAEAAVILDRYLKLLLA